MFCDTHSHILFDIDDGAQSREQSIAMLKMACDDGIKHIIATPHFIPGIYELSADEIYDRVAEINVLAQEAGLDITVYPGCEISADKISFELLSQGKIPTLCGSTYILLELSETYTENSIINIIKTAVNMGYTPVIAHIERCISHRQGMSFVQNLVQTGALLQINADSLVNPHIFWCQRRFIHKLLKKDLIFCVATDCHSDNMRPPVLSAAAQVLIKLTDPIRADKLLRSNPMKIIEA
ncbi:MAG: hypothetical protein IKV89_03165 [Clostridia bacterium]|nr:hypothetical protein [Clostridia bacterium]